LFRLFFFTNRLAFPSLPFASAFVFSLPCFSSLSSSHHLSSLPLHLPLPLPQPSFLPTSSPISSSPILSSLYSSSFSLSCSHPILPYVSSSFFSSLLVLTHRFGVICWPCGAQRPSGPDATPFELFATTAIHPIPPQLLTNGNAMSVQMQMQMAVLAEGAQKGMGREEAQVKMDGLALLASKPT
jgi:hypothetical protein